MVKNPALPPVRACIFDVDGLLINTEDIYIQIMNDILHTLGKPDLPWTVIARQQSRGRAGIENVLQWAKLDMSVDDFRAQIGARYAAFRQSKLLSGVETLLNNLARKPDLQLALASSARRQLFEQKTAHLAVITRSFEGRPQICGDDDAMANKQGKPAPDIFLLALEKVNEVRNPDTPRITEKECLVFEDSTAGVEGARRAGMRVVWVPHPKLREVYSGREDVVLAGLTDTLIDLDVETSSSGSEAAPAPPPSKDQGPIQTEDGFAELLYSLDAFKYEKYGIGVTTAQAT